MCPYAVRNARTDVAYAGTRANGVSSYATQVQTAAVSACAMSSTNLACDTTYTRATRCPVLTWRMAIAEDERKKTRAPQQQVLLAYALAMRCPVLG
eukprot:851952-Rhodomonas_salina.2